MGPRKLLLEEASFPFVLGKAHWILDANRTKSQSMANMVSLNILVLKNHILAQDTFGFQYLVKIVDMTMEEIIRSKDWTMPVPMELIEVFNAADEKLKVKKKKKESIGLKEFTRTYVHLWGRLYNFIINTFDYIVAERILLEAYNSLVAHKYYNTLKVI